MESELTDIYGFTDFPKYLDDDVFADKIDDMLVADIDMDMFDKIDNFLSTKSSERTPPSPPHSISSPLINPDDFLNDVDGDDGQTTCSNRSSPSLSNSPASLTSSGSCDTTKTDSSSDESMHAECLQQFQSYTPPTIVNPTPIFTPQSGPIRILQGTLIPVSAIKIEATPATVGTAQPFILTTTGSQCVRNKRNKIVLPKASSENDRKYSSIVSPKSIYEPISEQALKKQQRMIKNRESASLSRNKKREYVMTLETQVKSLVAENNILKNENKNLKAQISNMLATCQCRVSQYSYLTKTISPQTRKNAAILLTMVFMVSMSFGNINTLLSRHSSLDDKILTQPNAPVGRHLLWVDENATNIENSSLRNITKPIRCLSALNQTENNRIETDLRNWIGINDDSNATQNENDVFNFIPGFHNIFKPSFKNLYKTQRSSFKRKNPHYNPDWIEGRRRRYSGQQPSRAQKPKNQMQLFLPARKGRLSKLFEGIGRRDDTFYVLSFNNDHLLLSAANHNKSARPRMSFVLPADDSLSEDKVMLMQIDCEVMNTSVIELKKEFIPEHLRAPQANKNDSSKVPRNNTRSYDVPNKHDILSMADGLNRELPEKNELKRLYKPYFVEKSNFDKEPSGEFSDLFLT